MHSFVALQVQGILHSSRQKQDSDFDYNFDEKMLMQDDYIVYIIKAKSFPTTGRINETNITDRYSAQIEVECKA